MTSGSLWVCNAGGREVTSLNRPWRGSSLPEEAFNFELPVGLLGARNRAQRRFITPTSPLPATGIEWFPTTEAKPFLGSVDKLTPTR